MPGFDCLPSFRLLLFMLPFDAVCLCVFLAVVTILVLFN